MTGRASGDGAEAMDVATLVRDDALLDALGRGEPAPEEGDPVAVLLAVWRADVAGDTVVLRVVPGRRSRRRSWVMRLAAGVVAVAAVAAGLGAGSRAAEPGSPLWSLTRLLYPQEAEARIVEEGIARAGASLDAGRVGEAQRHVDQARGELPAIGDTAVADRFRGQLDVLAARIVAARAAATPSATPPASPVPAPVPSAAPPASPSPTGGATRTPATTPPAPATSAPPASGGEAEPEPSPTGGSPLPLPEPEPIPSLLSPLPDVPLLPADDLLG